MKTINNKLVAVALPDVDTVSFEKFGQAFYAAIIGKDFVPLGGMHDGGADGFFEPELFSDSVARHFLQVSKQGTYDAKITGTYKRLREFGRDPNAITYVTSEKIAHIDVEQERLSEALGCRVQIRDGTFIEAHINDSEATIAAFESYLRPALAYLNDPGAARVGERTAAHADKSLAVFLRQEVENRRGKTELLISVADSLIIWALTDTHPDKGKFKTRDEILAAIEAALPSTRQFIRGVLDDRLSKLRSKTSGDARKVRYYPKEKHYCLPFETRELVAAENLEDATLKVVVSSILEKRFAAVAAPEELGLAADVVRICHSAIERIFEKQGLAVALFATDGDPDEGLQQTAADLIAIAAAEDAQLADQNLVRRLAGQVLRGTFYDATPEERDYLQKLSRTYVLLLLLKNEPKVVEYFKSISSKFNLYVGTDFLVRALSEHYLDSENQTTRNLFAIVRKAGAKLILTEKAVEELATHIRSQIFEFENVYADFESKVTLDAVEYIDRILIRSYFFARLAPLVDSVPSGWRSFVQQFAPYEDIRSDRADEALARYLVAKFDMEYESAEEMSAGLVESEVDALAKEILRLRGERRRLRESAEVLAYNDALQVFRVYQRRRAGGESSPANPFGFKTWWLTQDGIVRRASASVVQQNGGKRFMMRPEFLLNFILFSPSVREVEDSYKEIFPSVLGIRLSNRVAADTFKKVLKDAKEIMAVDEARAAAMITECVNTLKADTVKVYEHEWN